MSNQTAFDIAVKGILGQGGLSMSMDGETCVYRGDDDRKCAIGHLLSDDQIATYQIRPNQTVSNFPGGLLIELKAQYELTNEIIFLEKLQNLHDDCICTQEEFTEKFTKSANEFASFHKLQGI